MNINIIIFCFGCGGNFLARVLTLDEKTVSLGKKNLTTKQRAEHYNYKNIDNKISGQYNTFLPSGLSNWANIELNEMFFPLSRGVDTLVKLNLDIVEPMHPRHYEVKLNYFGVDDNINVLYIDPTDCIDWIVDQRIHKGAYIDSIKNIKQSTLDEIDILNQVKNNAVPISLKNIISSDEKFLKEYYRACEVCNVKIFDSYALEIYKSWRRTWAL
jgi:hypothetical protein